MPSYVMVILSMIIILLGCNIRDHNVSTVGGSPIPEPAAANSHFDIFLSFRGNDTRENFASVLHGALHRAGFNVFRDDESIRIGDRIDSKIEEAIKNSKGAVILLSKDFASSKWCLNELVLIVERRNRLGSKYVLKPIYMEGVEFNDVQHQRGSYGTALAKHNKRWYLIDRKPSSSNVKEWRKALAQIGLHKGTKLEGNWDKFINKMVEEIREEFRTVLGIKVEPRSPISARGDPEKDLSTTTSHKTMESTYMIVGGNIEQMNVFVSSSSINQQQSSHCQSMPLTPANSYEEGSSFLFWAASIAVVISFQFLIMRFIVPALSKRSW